MSSTFDAHNAIRLLLRILLIVAKVCSGIIVVSAIRLAAVCKISEDFTRKHLFPQFFCVRGTYTRTGWPPHPQGIMKHLSSGHPSKPLLVSFVLVYRLCDQWLNTSYYNVSKAGVLAGRANRMLHETIDSVRYLVLLRCESSFTQLTFHYYRISMSRDREFLLSRSYRALSKVEARTWWWLRTRLRLFETV